MKHEPRILLYDIETSHNIVASFDLSTEYLPHENIIQERFIISACWQWYGESQVHSVSLLDAPAQFRKDHTNDRVVVEKLHELFSEADVIVAHYGDNFDFPMVQARAIKHGLPPTPPVTSVDTKKIASSRFRFNSNRLDYLGKYLGVGGKIHTDNSLWLKVLKGDQDAIRQMVRYNKQDVVVLAGVFKKLAPYMPNYISRELTGGTGCPRCGSKKVQSRGVHKAISRTYARFQCQTCGGWFRLAKSNSALHKHRIL